VLRLTVADLDPQLPNRSIGPKFVFIGVRDLAVLSRPRRSTFTHVAPKVCRSLGVSFCLGILDDAHTRRACFDANGVREDPATGSANSGLAAYLRAPGEADRRDRGAGLRDQAAVASLLARRCAGCALADRCRRFRKGGCWSRSDPASDSAPEYRCAEVFGTVCELRERGGDRSARSLARLNSPSAVPVQAESMFAAPISELRS
jgi:hypothetical protein